MIWVILAVILNWVLKRTKFGQYVYALGGNERAAWLSGVNVNKIRILTYIINGVFAALAGLIVVSRLMIATGDANEGYEMIAIAACVIGGVSFVGGIGKIRGIIIGVLMLRLIFVGLTMIQVPQDLIYLVKGGIILFACALDMRKYLVKK